MSQSLSMKVPLTIMRRLCWCFPRATKGQTAQTDFVESGRRWF
jgi:hypothetical protein